MNLNEIETIKKVKKDNTMKVPASKIQRKPKLRYRQEKNTVFSINEEFKTINLQESEVNIGSSVLDKLYFLNYALKESRKIIVVSGAGISVDAGIPDFRSSNGLFLGAISAEKEPINSKTVSGSEDNLDTVEDGTSRYKRSQKKPTLSSKQLFTSNVYTDANLTGPFHRMVVNLFKLSNSCKPSKFHHFLNSLDDCLLRNYTQNIDCLDTQLDNCQTVTPLSSLLKKNKGKNFPKTIQLHGSVKTMCCTKCEYMSDLEPSAFQSNIPIECSECIEINSVKAIVGKRTSKPGIIRPRFVLYNEFHPDGEVIGSIVENDLKKSKPDCLIIVGTTLKIPGVRRLVKEMSKTVKTNANGCIIWIDIVKPGNADLKFINEIDLVVEGNCQDIPDIIEFSSKLFEDKRLLRNVGKCQRNRSEVKSDGQSKIGYDRDGKLVNQKKRKQELFSKPDDNEKVMKKQMHAK